MGTVTSQWLDNLGATLGLRPSWYGASIGQIITDLLPYIFPIAGLILLVYLIYGGFEVMTSAGDPKKLAVGKDKITKAIFGFLIIFAAFWIVQIVARMLGLTDIINIFG
jgi:hypothetical protein